jgi:hypothetical protein
VTKIATHNPDGSIRRTPLTYGFDGNGRDARASVLLDKVDEP